jgi:hypothetical protein
MLGNFALGHSKNIHSHHWFWSPAHITAMNHDDVAVGCNHARFVIEVPAERGNDAENRVGAVRNCGVVLRIVLSKVRADNRQVATDKTPVNTSITISLLLTTSAMLSPFSP